LSGALLFVFLLCLLLVNDGSERFFVEFFL